MSIFLLVILVRQELRSASESIQALLMISINVGAACKVCPHWSQKAITHHCLSLFSIVSRLGYRTNWLLGLGELLHDR